MFKTRNLIFKDFIFYPDIHVVESKINFIVGESGCGKSTLLKLFNRTENFSSGAIYYKDIHIAGFDSIDLRKEVKLISQSAFLFSGTIKENYNLFYTYCERENLTEEQMLYFLRLTEANFPLNTPCDNLSGGERQRVYIAICLSMQAKTIMLDEPTSALDHKLSVKVLENIVSYVKNNDLTLIVISHDKTLTEMFAETIIDISGGKQNE